MSGKSRYGSTSTPDVLKHQRIDLDLIQLATATKTVPNAQLQNRVTELFESESFTVSRWYDFWKIFQWFVPKWDRLSFNMQAQQQTNWCWAAVSTSVSHYYNSSSTWTQCQVANAQIGRTDCCGTGASGPCNIYGYLGDALTRVGHFNYQTGTVSDNDIDSEVASDRPVGIRVAWSGGGAHFLAIIGFLSNSIFVADDQDFVAVDDPIYGKSDISWAVLQSAYQGSGSWTHTYFTQP